MCTAGQFRAVDRGGASITAKMSVASREEGGRGRGGFSREPCFPGEAIAPPPLPQPPRPARHPLDSKRRERRGGGGEEGAGSRERTTARVSPPSPSHDGAALGLLLLEVGGEQVGLAGEVEQSLGEASGGAGLGQGLQLVDAGQRRRAEHAVDALLRGEGGALQVGLRTQLLGHGRALVPAHRERETVSRVQPDGLT